LEMIGAKYPPKRWKLAKNEKLPFILRLDENRGTIKGFIWAKGVYNIMFEVTLSNNEKISVPLKMVID